MPKKGNPLSIQDSEQTHQFTFINFWVQVESITFTEQPGNQQASERKGENCFLGYLDGRLFLTTYWRKVPLLIARQAAEQLSGDCLLSGTHL